MRLMDLAASLLEASTDASCRLSLDSETVEFLSGESVPFEQTDQCLLVSRTALGNAVANRLRRIERIAEIGLQMHDAGVPSPFIERVAAESAGYGLRASGFFDLMCLWSENADRTACLLTMMEAIKVPR